MIRAARKPVTVTPEDLAELRRIRREHEINTAIVQSAQKEITALTRALAEAVLLIDATLAGKASWTPDEVERLAQLRKMALL